MFCQDRAQLPAVVPVKPETLADAEVLVPLAELADLPAGKDLLLGSLEVGLDYESAVVDEAVLVDDVEDLTVDVY